MKGDQHQQVFLAAEFSRENVTGERLFKNARLQRNQMI